jgi:hypothetical protein
MSKSKKGTDSSLPMIHGFGMFWPNVGKNLIYIAILEGKLTSPSVNTLFPDQPKC